jgi:hypothetical protein
LEGDHHAIHADMAATADAANALLRALAGDAGTLRRRGDGYAVASGAGAIARRAPAKPRYQAQYQDQYQNQYQGQTYGDDDTTGTLAAARPAPVYREPRYDDEDDRYYAPPRRYNGGGFPFGW